MIRTVLIDEDAKTIKQIVELVRQHCPQLHIEGTASSMQQSIQLLQQVKPELVLLDTELSGENSFRILEQVNQLNFEKIFVTAEEKFGIQAVKHNASDYILKPINTQELISAIEKTTRIIYAKQAIAIRTQLDLALHTRHKNRLSLPCLDGLIFVELDKIRYCESEGRYTRFYMYGNEKKLTVSKNIGEYEQVLTPQENFVRIHSHYIVNLNYVIKYVKGRGGYVILDNGKNLDVSARKKEDFLRQLERYFT